MGLTKNWSIKAGPFAVCIFAAMIQVPFFSVGVPVIHEAAFGFCLGLALAIALGR